MSYGIRKREVQERHDYNYAMYRTLYKKNEKLRSITLMQMARQQIELHRPQMALQALELVKREKLNVAQLRSFTFIRQQRYIWMHRRAGRKR